MDKIKKVILILFSFFILPINASAASLYFTPNSGSHDIGSIFSVSVYVSSPDEAINAASGIVNFSKEKLEVVSLSKSNSIFSLWVKEPSFSNTSGTVSFEGVVLSSGFTGKSGKILTINFKTKKAGNESISFSSSSILANDGNGTDIISNTETAQFSIIDDNPPIEEEPAPILKKPATPTVSSSTHGDQDKWYNSNDVKLSWDVSTDIDRIRVVLNKIPNSTPNILYESSIKEKEFSDLEDGVWYFHTQFRNELGWGSINHFKIQIDTKAPEPFKISVVSKEGETSRPIVSFSATDSLSGIDHYKIRIGQDSPFNISPEEMKNGEYALPEQLAGNRMLMVQAVDKANNYFSVAEEFTVGSLENPIITECPKELTSEDFLNIKGTSKYPDSQVNIYFERDQKTIGVKKVDTDTFGNFYLAYEGNLKNGTYDIKAEVVDSNGLKSIDNQPISIIVKDPEFIKVKAEILKIAIPLVSLFLILFVWVIYYKLKLSKKRLRKEVTEAENMVRESFDSLKKELSNKIKSLNNKNETELTQEEKETIQKLQKSVNYLEKLMNKEISDIKKEVK